MEQNLHTIEFELILCDNIISPKPWPLQLWRKLQTDSTKWRATSQDHDNLLNHGIYDRKFLVMILTRVLKPMFVHSVWRADTHFSIFAWDRSTLNKDRLKCAQIIMKTRFKKKILLTPLFLQSTRDESRTLHGVALIYTTKLNCLTFLQLLSDVGNKKFNVYFAWFKLW